MYSSCHHNGYMQPLGLGYSVCGCKTAWSFLMNSSVSICTLFVYLCNASVELRSRTRQLRKHLSLSLTHSKKLT